MKTRLWSLACGAAFITPAIGLVEARAQDGDIIVTAQKREQLLSDVPINITAYNGEFLDRVGVDKFDELAEFVPGLQIQEQSANNPAFVIRGITSDSGEATTEPRVAVFQDGVSMSRSRGSYVELFDIERVEVAKGPQATLFGRSALIGGINIIQNKAAYDGPIVAAEGSVGDEGQGNFTAAVNAVLLPDVAAVRVSGRYRTRDGFVDNTLDGSRLGDNELEAYRIAARLDPTDTLRFDFIANYQADEATGTAFISNRVDTTAGFIDVFSAGSLNSFGGFLGDEPLGLEREIYSATLLGEWEASEAFTLNSITGYREFDSLEVFDPDGSYLPLFIFAEDATGEQFSQEFRLNWESGGRFSGFIGASYFREEGAQRVPLGFDERLSLALLSGQLQAAFPSPVTAQFQNPLTTAALITGLSDLDGPLGPALPLVTGATASGIAANLQPLYTEFFENGSETDSYDLYADLTFKATERLQFSAGVRYTYDDKTSSFEANILDPAVARSVLGTYFGGIQQLGAAALAFQNGQISGADFAAAQADFLSLAGALATPNASFIPQSLLFPVPNVGLQFQPTPGVVEAGDTFDAVTWRFVARYELSEAASVWASFARGRRPEVITAEADPLRPPGVAPDFDVLPAELVDSYEIGGALTLLNGLLDLSGSVFTYDYTDFQTFEFIGGRLVTITAGDASSYGFEGQANWTVHDLIDLFGNYAYNRSRFETGARDGNSFRLSPDHEFSVGAFLRYPIGDAGHAFFTPTYSWRSKVYFDDDNDLPQFQNDRISPVLSDTVVDEFQDAYGLLNLRVGFEGASGAWAIEAYANNVLDEDYLIDAGNAGDSFGLPTFIRGPSRLLGVVLRAQY